MKLSSMAMLWNDYSQKEGFIQYRSQFSKSLKIGSIAFVSYTSLAVGPRHAPALRKKQLALRFAPQHYNFLSAIVVKKSATSFTVASNFRGYFFYKVFLRDSPNLISVKTKVKSYFKGKGTNITGMIKPGTAFWKKLKKLR